MYRTKYFCTQKAIRNKQKALLRVVDLGDCWVPATHMALSPLFNYPKSDPENRGCSGCLVYSTVRCASLFVMRVQRGGGEYPSGYYNVFV